jgi:hypothetical protein
MQRADMHFTVTLRDELLTVLVISYVFSEARLPRNSCVSQHELPDRRLLECIRSLSIVLEKKHCYSNGLFSN